MYMCICIYVYIRHMNIQTYTCTHMYIHRNQINQRIAYSRGKASLRGPEGRIWLDDF